MTSDQVEGRHAGTNNYSLNMIFGGVRGLLAVLAMAVPAVLVSRI